MYTQQNISQPVSGISHPLVADIYLKKDLINKHNNVLVIEARNNENFNDHEEYDSYLIDLLVDLEDLKNKAQQKVGSFDRIDIRTAH